MKLIIRQYLASLRERGELDAVLPDLLSELGYTVYSRPQRGTTQLGVDVAAVGATASGEQKVFLFSIKSGDLTRRDWNTGDQALRPSLDQILDAYIPTRIPPEYKDLNIVICLCYGGDIHETIQTDVVGYTTRHTTDKVTFEQWNGDKLAGLIIQGVLREDILPKELRSHFQKSVALVDEPDVSYLHFSRLINELGNIARENTPLTVRSARQLYICLWIMFVWARDVSNLEAPYRSCELALLHTWQLVRQYIGNDCAENRAITGVINQLISLHLLISSELIDVRIAPHVMKRDALSVAVRSHASVDINISLFEILGRIGMHALWLNWASQRAEETVKQTFRESISRYTALSFSLIANNPALGLPVKDDQATDIALFLISLLATDDFQAPLARWLLQMLDRYHFTLRTRGRFPTIYTDYRDLAEHPRDNSQGYLEEATAGSTLLPLLTLWAGAMGLEPAVKTASKIASEHLKHCTMQLWVPSSDSEEHLYLNSESHGRAIYNLPISPNHNDLLEVVSEACKADDGLTQLSAMKAGFWPVVLIACRHWRLPIPPQFYIAAFEPEPMDSSEATTNSPDDGLKTTTSDNSPVGNIV